MSLDSNSYSEPSHRWAPKKEFYTKNQEANVIREICLEVTRCLDALAHDQPVDNNEQETGRLHSRLEILNGQLIEHGVAQHMYVRDPRIGADPLVSVKYVAGQLLDVLDRSFKSSAGIKPIVEELTDSVADNVRMGELNDASRGGLSNEFIIEGAILTSYYYLGAETEEKYISNSNQEGSDIY